MVKWFVLLILLIPVTVLGDINFTWTLYEDNLATCIRLYRDGSTIIEQDDIPMTDTTVAIPTPTDNESHAYYIVGVQKNSEGVEVDKSDPSDIGILNPKCPPCIKNVKEMVIPNIE